jgi:hypothetical protein
METLTTSPPTETGELKELLRKSRLGARFVFDPASKTNIFSVILESIGLRESVYDSGYPLEIGADGVVFREGRKLLRVGFGRNVPPGGGIRIWTPPNVERAALGRIVHMRAVVRSEGGASAEDNLAMTYTTGGSGNSGLAWFGVPAEWSMIEASWAVPSRKGERAAVAMMPGPTSRILIAQAALAIGPPAGAQEKPGEGSDLAKPAPAPEGAAGIVATEARQARLQGSVDYLSPSRVAGWVWDPDNPDARLQISIEVDGTEVGSVVADRFRSDLLAAGKGDGAHGFNIEMPGARPASEASIRCVVGSGFVLPLLDAARRGE